MSIDPPSPVPNFVDPHKILAELELTEGESVADLGCGSGFLAFEAAKLVGESGQVYAVDIQKTVLSAVQSKINLQGTRNIKTVWADVEVLGSTKIKNDSIDTVLLASIFYQTKKHGQILAEAKRIAKTGGKIVIIDWEQTNIPMGPDVKLRVLKDEIRKKAEAIDLKFTNEVEVDSYHYGLVFVK
ncbi:methyltransferase domain-containing protein [Patescibacteria group bacterium]|nr:methyltransferase domain-containing protein [Patescibacteria group bacterium]